MEAVTSKKETSTSKGSCPAFESHLQEQASKIVLFSVTQWERTRRFCSDVILKRDVSIVSNIGLAKLRSRPGVCRVTKGGELVICS